MRGKRARALRKQARKLSVGMPERQLVAKMHIRTVIIKNKPEKYRALQAFNDPKSTRGKYRALKKGLAA